MRQIILRQIVAFGIAPFVVHPVKLPWDPLWQWYEKKRILEKVPDLAFREIEFGPDSHRVWLFEPKSHRPETCVLLVHGFVNSRASMARPARDLLHHGAACCMMDLPGHGHRKGTCTFGVREAEEVAAMARHLREGLGYEKTVLMGMSMGASTVLQSLQHKPRADAAVALAPYAAFRNVVGDYAHRFTRHRLPRTCETVLERVSRLGKYDTDAASPREVLRHLEEPLPLLVVHGTRDRNIQPYHMDMLAEAYDGPGRYLHQPGANHYTLLWPRHRRQWMPKVVEFLREHDLLETVGTRVASRPRQAEDPTRPPKTAAQPGEM